MTRVLFKPPTRRDGEAACQTLAQAGIELVTFLSFDELVREMPDRVGALLLTELAVTEPGFDKVLEALQRQPAWSDMAVVLMVRKESSELNAVVQRLTNVTLLDRPSSVRTLTSTLQAALRARQRQYQIRDQLIELEQAHQTLRQADRHKDEFIATLAHELRNPLSPIRTAAHLLSKSSLSAEALARSTQMIARQTHTMAQLLDDLLDVARVSSGKLSLHQAEAQIGTIVESAVEAARPLFDGKQHQLDIQVPVAERIIECDALRISQALTNLLANAAKYTDPGGRIELLVQARDGNVEFSVRDNGMGIDGDMLPNLFQMFMQIDGSHGRAGGGLGIGLALSRSLVEMHGGRLLAYSAGIGLGSEFTIVLPDRHAGLGAGTAAPAPPLEQNPSGGARVLVVDDNEDAAIALAMLLRMEGFDAAEVFGGESALEEAARHPPAAMLVDIGMADLDGYEVARRLRAEPWGANIFLVACTGWGQTADKRFALDAGFDVHMTKPVDPLALSRLLEERLSHREQASAAPAD